MELTIGAIIARSRKRTGLDQRELAGRLGGIGQQTISRWERGLSRPRRNMVGRLAQVLDLPTSELLVAAGYVAATADSPSQVVSPVHPGLTRLRLGELAPDRFEQFTADLAQLLDPHTRVHRQGGAGHKQHGVDVLAMQGRAIAATFQCKRVDRFGPADVRAAVASVAVSAPAHYLMLTRVASPAARAEIVKHEGWQLLDVEDISQIVRLRLPRDAAVRLVDTYFPGWREPFLGVPEPGPWLTVDEYFSPLLGDQLFSHRWRLVGRDTDLTNVRKFLEKRRGRIAAIVGRGGIGKTRLLRSVAEIAMSTPSMDVRFLAIGAEVRPEHYELLPRAPLLLVIDDAHERTDIAELLGGIGRAAPQAKLLLSLRPYGMTQLAYDLRRVGVRTSDFPVWQLEDLKVRDAEALARSILGPRYSATIIKRLGGVSTDCPLITVVGASLLKRGSLDPARLEADESIRQAVLLAFRDSLVGDPATGDPELRRSVLHAVSVLQPVRTNEPDFQAALEKLTGVPFDRVVPHLRSLEDAGVLLRRSKRLRIVPDLLGDVILGEACVDSRSGVSTGYLERCRQAADGEALQSVFVNASRVDWQVQRDPMSVTPLVDTLWSSLEDEFRAAGIRGRLSFLKLLQKVSFFQPARTLAIIRWALEHPTDIVEDPDHPLARVYAPSPDDVTFGLPPVLRYCAYTFEYLPEALDLLWRIGRTDTRPTNQHPNHAIRVLCDLADYDTRKPLQFNEAVVDAAERWLREDDAGGPHSPFDVLEPLLATEGTDYLADGVTLSFRPYLVNVKVVEPLRERVVALTMREARNPDPERSVGAIMAIEAGLHYPRGLFGRQVDARELDEWTRLFVRTIEQLEPVAADAHLDPIVSVAIRRALNWHARYATGDSHAAALKVLARIPRDPKHELALLMHDGWGRILTDHLDDYEEAERVRQGRFKALAATLATNKSDAEVTDLVEQRLEVQQRVSVHLDGSPAQFVWTLVHTRPSIGEEICVRVAQRPESALQGVLPVVLGQLPKSDPQRAIALVRALLGTGSLAVARAVAQAFGWNRGRREELVQGERVLLDEFAVHEDPWIRSSATHALQMMIEHNRAEALELLSRIRFADSPKVAQEVFMTFAIGSLSWKELSAPQVQAILDQLVLCPSIDDYHIMQFLNELSKESPDEVLRVLRERVERSEQDGGADFRALPFTWHDELHLRSHSRFEQDLRGILAWLTQGSEPWQRQYFGAELFRVVAGAFDERVLAVLEEATASRSQCEIESVGVVLREAPRHFVWENVGFIRRLLNAAAAYGEDCLERVGSSLHRGVTSGVRSGPPEEPFPEDVAQRDKAAEIASGLPNGSVEQRFYRSLQMAAEASIRWSADEDERLGDGRDW